MDKILFLLIHSPRKRLRGRQNRYGNIMEGIIPAKLIRGYAGSESPAFKMGARCYHDATGNMSVHDAEVRNPSFAGMVHLLIY
jgi:hypothetical protein